MDRLSRNETRRWLAKHSVAANGKRYMWSNCPCFGVDVQLDGMSRTFAILSTHVARACSNVGRVLLSVDAWNIWPSEESWSLFDRAMRGFGDNRSIGDAPGLLFCEDEVDEFRDFARLALISGWCAGVVTEAGQLVFSLTDDEWFAIVGQNRVVVEAWKLEFMRSFEHSHVLWEGEL